MGTKLLDGLNDEQRQAVTHGEGPLLIVAGAGTGKTTVITRRIAWLIEQKKCKPEEILSLTFTDKAAGEMEERVDRLLPYGYVNLWISTFHSFCERILKRHALDIGLPNEFTLLDTTASWTLVRKNLDRFDLDYYRPLNNPTKFIHALLKHFSRLKDEAITPSAYRNYAESLAPTADSALGDAPPSLKLRRDEGADDLVRIHELANAYATYQKLLLENNALDFGDLILFALSVFQNRPAILARYHTAFQYILVDEFQDTNSAQYELIKLLAAPQNNLTVVGDDDQAIFRWRGASFENIISFKKDYPKSIEIVLTNNYRSPQNILDSAYAFIQKNNPNRLEHQLQEQGQPLSKQLVSADALPGPLDHIHCATHDDEVAAVVEKIVQLRDSAGTPGSSWGDFCILVRANDAADPFLAALSERGIPFHFLAHKGLYAKPVIIDVTSYLAVLTNCHDSPALYRVFCWPLWELGHDSLVELSHYAHKSGVSLWAAAGQIDLLSAISEEDREKITHIRDLLERHGSVSRTAKMTELFLIIIKDTGLLESVSKDETQKEREQLALLNEFFSKIKTFQTAEPAGTVREFSTLLAFEQEAGDEGSLARMAELDPDAVSVMTIHGSKGLEFPYVFLVGMVDQRFPTRERADAIPLPAGLVADISASPSAHLEEERRLMYVALTRAKRGFWCSSAEDYGGSRKRKPSQFLGELGFMPSSAIVIASEVKQSSLMRSNTGLSGRAESGLAGLPVTRNDAVRLPSSFSFSQLAAFRNCPLQYKFSFLLKIPTFGKSHFSFGKSMHAALQKFAEQILESVQKNEKHLFCSAEISYTEHIPSKDELFRLFESAWIDEWYSSRKSHDEHKNRGQAMLSRFYDDFCAAQPLLKAVERDFSIIIGHGDDQCRLRGRIDRIDSLKNGGSEIVDYKTGTPKKENSLAFSDREQLLLYQLASEQLGESVEKLTYHYLENGTKITFLGSEKDTHKLIEKIKTTVSELKQSDFTATPGWHCRHCDFRDICEYRQ